jgi:hypothetical protein
MVSVANVAALPSPAKEHCVSEVAADNTGENGSYSSISKAATICSADIVWPIWMCNEMSRPFAEPHIRNVCFPATSAQILTR